MVLLGILYGCETWCLTLDKEHTYSVVNCLGVDVYMG